MCWAGGTRRRDGAAVLQHPALLLLCLATAIQGVANTAVREGATHSASGEQNPTSPDSAAAPPPHTTATTPTSPAETTPSTVESGTGQAPLNTTLGASPLAVPQVCNCTVQAIPDGYYCAATTEENGTWCSPSLEVFAGAPMHSCGPLYVECYSGPAEEDVAESLWDRYGCRRDDPRLVGRDTTGWFTASVLCVVFEDTGGTTCYPPDEVFGCDPNSYSAGHATLHYGPRTLMLSTPTVNVSSGGGGGAVSSYLTNLGDSLDGVPSQHHSLVPFEVISVCPSTACSPSCPTTQKKRESQGCVIDVDNRSLLEALANQELHVEVYLAGGDEWRKTTRYAEVIDAVMQGRLNLLKAEKVTPMITTTVLTHTAPTEESQQSHTAPLWLCPVVIIISLMLLCIPAFLYARSRRRQAPEAGSIHPEFPSAASEGFLPSPEEEGKEMHNHQEGAMQATLWGDTQGEESLYTPPVPAEGQPPAALTTKNLYDPKLWADNAVVIAGPPDEEQAGRIQALISSMRVEKWHRNSAARPVVPEGRDPSLPLGESNPVGSHHFLFLESDTMNSDLSSVLRDTTDNVSDVEMTI